jgi:hypothetical protein
VIAQEDKEGLMSTPAFSLWIFFSTAIVVGTSSSVLSEGDLRLVDGDTATSGRVEIYHSGSWGTVCDNNDLFTLNEAHVVCRQLGYPVGNALFYGGSHYGKGKDFVWLLHTSCNGNESRLSDCPNFTWENAAFFCHHDNDVGVDCSKF